MYYDFEIHMTKRQRLMSGCIIELTICEESLKDANQYRASLLQKQRDEEMAIDFC